MHALRWILIEAESEGTPTWRISVRHCYRSPNIAPQDVDFSGSCCDLLPKGVAVVNFFLSWPHYSPAAYVVFGGITAIWR